MSVSKMQTRGVEDSEINFVYLINFFNLGQNILNSNYKSRIDFFENLSDRCVHKFLNDLPFVLRDGPNWHRIVSKWHLLCTQVALTIGPKWYPGARDGRTKHCTEGVKMVRKKLKILFSFLQYHVLSVPKFRPKSIFPL